MKLLLVLCTVRDKINWNRFGCHNIHLLSLLGWCWWLIYQLINVKNTILRSSCPNQLWKLCVNCELCSDLFWPFSIRLVMVTGSWTFAWLLYSHIIIIFFKTPPQSSSYNVLTVGIIFLKYGLLTLKFDAAKNSGNFQSRPHNNSSSWKQAIHNHKQIYFQSF